MKQTELISRREAIERVRQLDALAGLGGYAEAVARLLKLCPSPEDAGPCSLCAFAPASSADGKPCCFCPAQ